MVKSKELNIYEMHVCTVLKLNLVNVFQILLSIQVVTWPSVARPNITFIKSRCDIPVGGSEAEVCCKLIFISEVGRV